MGTPTRPALLASFFFAFSLSPGPARRPAHHDLRPPPPGALAVPPRPALVRGARGGKEAAHRCRGGGAARSGAGRPLPPPAPRGRGRCPAGRGTPGGGRR